MAVKFALRYLPLTSLLLLLPAANTALALTGRADLEKWCQRGSSAAIGRCHGYLRAAADVLSTDSIDGVRACLPHDTNMPEMQRRVMTWLTAHPTATATTAMGLVARALSEIHPCQK